MATRRPASPFGDEDEARPRKRPNLYRNTSTSDGPAYCAPVPNLSHADYTIAWICALHLELAASRAMLDEEHESLTALDGDHNAYVLGRIAKHNVVMAVLPGSYGKVKAAAVSTHLKRSFPNIKATLMVGIGGGAPGEADLYLGDVVVGTRVMEYDLGKAINEGEFECTAHPKLPSSLLLSYTTALRSKHRENQSSPRAQELMRTKLACYPRPTQPDRLFQASYPHLLCAKTCDDCDVNRLQPRKQRFTEDFWIHYGVVASGDSVNKDARKRDTVSRRLQAKCFEMEAAGIMDSLECLPIRGICDYSDSHKNKAWQDYAAATAASYARELLESMPPLIAGQAPSIVRDTATPSVPLSPSAELIDRRNSFLDVLDFPQINSRKNAIRAEQGRTCRWFLKHPKYLDWIGLSSQVPRFSCLLWIRGKAGAGKSTLMKFLYSEAKKQRSGAAVVSFFFNARGEYLEKSIEGMYRSLLKQILTHIPDLQSILDQMEFSSTGEPAFPSLNALKDLFRNIVMALDRQSLICFIDALDECDEDQVRDMVHFFEDLTESAADEEIQFRVCFSSRPYPYIQVNEDILLTLENETGHAEDLAKYVQKCFKVSNKLRDDLQREILKKASGIFMWVVLVVGILNKEASRGGLALHRRLSEIPPSLSQLFKDILTRDKEKPAELRRCILWVLCAYRPLTPSEFCHAMWAGGLEDGQVDEEVPDVDDNEAHMALASSSSKGLIEVTNDTKKRSRVQFIHESVRDFLIKEKGLQDLWPDLGFEWEGPSHENLRSCCETYLMHPAILAVLKGGRTTDADADNGDKHDVTENCPAGGDTSNSLETPIAEAASTETYALLEYATQHILHHANKAAPSVPQKGFLSRFFQRLGAEAMDRCQPVKIRRYGPTASPLYILADRGLANLIPLKLGTQPLPRYDRALPFKHPLFAAMANDHKDAVAALLGLPSVIYEGENLMEGLGRRSNLINFKDRTPITWAAQEGRLKLVEVLVRNGESFISEDPGGKTALQRASKSGLEKLLHFFVDNGGNVNNFQGAQMIGHVIAQCHHKAAKILLEHFTAWGALPDYPWCDAGEWLWWAALRGYEDIVKLCFENGGKLEEGARHSINVAVDGRHLNIVEFLADKGADLNSGSVTRAAMFGYLDIVEFLADRGADLNSGSVATAASFGNLDIVKFLVDKGADLESGLVGKAAEKGHLDIVEFLADKGADLNSGSVAAAASFGHLDIVEFLLDKGADPTIDSIKEAVRNGHLKVVELLVNKGAPIDRSLIYYAERKGHRNMVEFLESH